MALGSKNGQRWRVGIQHPRQPGPLATVELDDGEAIGTSGDYQRYFEVDGKRYAICSIRAAAGRRTRRRP
jgi:thiamine biosynthesis lipoprotein